MTWLIFERDDKRIDIVNVEQIGWYYIKDGEVKLWKGAFEESKPKEGEEDGLWSEQGF
ncbi:hypothetical protein [Thermococcus sp.]